LFETQSSLVTGPPESYDPLLCIMSSVVGGRNGGLETPLQFLFCLYLCVCGKRCETRCNLITNG